MRLSILIPVSLLMAGCSSAPKEDSVRTLKTSGVTKGSESSKATSVKEDPSSPLLVAVQSGKTDELYQLSTSRLSEQPNDLEALNALGVFHLRKNQPEVALYFFNKAINLAPQKSNLYVNRGLAYLNQNKRQEALTNFRKSLELDNDSPLAATYLGWLYLTEKDYEKAVTAFQIAAPKMKNRFEFLNNQAVALIGVGKYTQAQSALEEALRLSPNNRQLLLNQAGLWIEHLNQSEKGLEILNRLKLLGLSNELRARHSNLENLARSKVK